MLLDGLDVDVPEEEERQTDSYLTLEIAKTVDKIARPPRGYIAAARR